MGCLNATWVYLWSAATCEQILALGATSWVSPCCLEWLSCTTDIVASWGLYKVLTQGPL